MSDLSWNTIRQQVYERAGGCCEYCQSCEEITGQGMHIEHIIPKVQAGRDSFDNLCLSCADCNAYKAIYTSVVDTDTGETISLYNPRSQKWHEHFQWSSDGLMLIGLTSVGRVTMERLKLNRERLTKARKRCVEARLHPPK